MTEAVDPDPHSSADDGERSTLGGREETSSGADPTMGGKEGQVGTTPSIAADETSDGTSWPVGGGAVSEESDQSPAGG